MTTYTEYCPETGNISRIVETDDVFVPQEGFSFIVGGYRDDMFRIENGVPIDVEPPSNSIDAWALLRIERNMKLAACDWTQVSDAPVDQAAWAAYRQALRDLPASIDDPDDVIWPTPPSP